MVTIDAGTILTVIAQIAVAIAILGLIGFLGILVGVRVANWLEDRRISKIIEKSKLFEDNDQPK